jgi:hypothetical protein
MSVGLPGMRRSHVRIVFASLVLSTRLFAQPPADLAATLARVGQRVEQYYGQARSIVCIETAVRQPLDHALAPDGFSSRFVYELHVEWDPPMPGERAGDARVVRQLLTVNGRPPRPKDAPACDAEPLSPEPLALFLPARQSDYVFSLAGMGRAGGREAQMLDYRVPASTPPDVVWTDDCVHVDVPARTQGRAWVDRESGDVLRMDEHLNGQFEFPLPRNYLRGNGPASFILTRADSSTVYKPVTFADPDETVLLPASITVVQVIENSGAPRLRITRMFSGYKRFTTGARIVR